MAVQRDRADSLQLALKQTLMQVKQEQEARSKADKLVHELWAKLNEVEKEAKASATKSNHERLEMQQALKKLTLENEHLRLAESGRQKQARSEQRAVHERKREVQAQTTKAHKYRDAEEQRRLELGKVCGPAPIPHPIIGLNQD